MTDAYMLQRFVEAQDAVYAQVLQELSAGEKRTHWMWFVFPQIRGLGSSAMAQRYALQSLEEARAYLAEPSLGPRLHECTALVNAVQDRTVSEIFGYPDDLKFHSSMTLFARADGDEAGSFQRALQKFFSGQEDEATVRMLQQRS